MSRQTQRQNVEDYSRYDSETHSGGNLTPLQRMFARWWEAARPYQMGRKTFRHAVFGFKGRKVNGQLEPLSAATKIRTVESVSFLAAVPLLKTEIGGDTRQGKYRINYLELSGRVEDGQVVFGGKPDGTYRQADLSRRPLQDHQVYIEQVYNPGSVGGQIEEARGAEAPVLVSPIYGQVEVIVDDLHVRLTVEGHDMYRFLRNDFDAIEILCGAEVQAGQPLAKLLRPVTYLAAEPWASNPGSRACKPTWDRIACDGLSATRANPQLSFGVQALELLLEAAENRLVWAADWPEVLVQVTADQWKQRRALGWRATPAFKESLLQAVSPDGLALRPLQVISPVDGVVAKRDIEPSFQKLTIQLEDGKTRLLVTPACSNLPAVGELVTAGEPLGDWAPRAYYSSYQELEEVAADGLHKIEDAWLQELSLQSGDAGWQGEGALIPYKYASCLQEQSSRRLLNMEPVLQYCSTDYGIAVMPPMEFDPRQGFTLTKEGVFYDFAPLGRPAGKPSTPRGGGKRENAVN